MNRKVVLLDADMGLANADIICNVQPRYNFAARGRAGQKTLAEVMTPGAGGIFAGSGSASGLARMADLTERRSAEDYWTDPETFTGYHLTVLTIDTGAGIGRNALASYSCRRSNRGRYQPRNQPPSADAYRCAAQAFPVRCGTAGCQSV